MAINKGSALTIPGGSEPARARASRRSYPRKDNIVLDAAEKVFIELGYAKTSMDGVAECAGVSKRTIYSNFRNKEALFAAVIAKRCEEILPGALEGIDLRTPDPEPVLIGLATAFLKSIFSKPQVNLYQTTVASARRSPSIGKMMYEGPIANTRSVFEQVLRAQAELGHLSIPDPRFAAAQLIALLKTDVHMQLMFAQPVRLTKARIGEIAASCVHLFLYGAATGRLRKSLND